MLRKLMMTTAVGALMIGSAAAQTGTSTTATDTSPRLVQSQASDQWLASKFKGTDVLGSDNSKIGDVSDILFDKSGSIQAYVISIGGLLGVGSKDVAIAPSSFSVVPAEPGGYDKLKLSMTQDQLKQAANFEPYAPPASRTTTGLGTTPMAPASRNPVTPAR